MRRVRTLALLLATALVLAGCQDPNANTLIPKPTVATWDGSEWDDVNWE